MSNFKHLIIKSEGNILTIIFDGPSPQHPSNSAVMEELKQIILSFYDDDSLKGCIITGNGDKVFATGALEEEIGGLNAFNGRKFSENGQETLSLIENCHKPIVAAINGEALSGGLEIALACHFRLATENAVFAFPDISIGLVPCFGGTQRLPKLIGKAHTLELLMTGDPITAHDALKMGLITSKVNTRELLIKKSIELLQRIINNAPLAIGMIVDCVSASYESEGYQMEANSFTHCCDTEDFKEGILARSENREPEFKGT